MDTNQQPLTDQQYLLERFPGKGGWTYARIPEVIKDKTVPFGWVRVSGTIDGFVITGHSLMPMADGQLFLSVKASIRKKIGKEAGDHVHVVLYKDEMPVALPPALHESLADEPAALAQFRSYGYTDQKAIVNWIEAAKTDEIRVQRIAETINKLLGIR